MSEKECVFVCARAKRSPSPDPVSNRFLVFVVPNVGVVRERRIGVVNHLRDRDIKKEMGLRGRCRSYTTTC